MKSWTIGLLLLAVAIPAISSAHIREHKQASTDLPQEDGVILDVAGEELHDGEELELDLGDDEEGEGRDASGIFIKNDEIGQNGGILIVQSGPSSVPLMFELRPVDDDDEMRYADEEDETDVVDGMNMEAATDNRYKPSTSLDKTETDDEEEEDNDQGMTVTNLRVRPTQKPKRKRVSTTVKPIKKRKRPASQAVQKKKKKNSNRVQNQNKRKNKNKKQTMNKNKQKNPNRRRKPVNNRRPIKPIRRIKPIRKQVVNKQSLNANRRKKLGVKVNKKKFANTVTNTVTTTQTGSADDVPNVNYIVINKPTEASTTQKPFWDILGRSAGSHEVDKSFKRGFNKRMLG